jgi:N-acyl-D-amino-acid deacylase
MPRLMGHYVRDEHLLLLEQAIRKITPLPAQRERLRDRGLLKESYFADITIFDPATIQDHATYENPTQLSEGVKYVFVIGQLKYEGGHLTETKAGECCMGQDGTEPASASSRLPSPLSPSQCHRFEE